MKLPLILRIFKNDQLVDVKQFDADQIVIGNKAEVNLDLDDISVAPIHALIEKRDNGHYYICDLGSNSGTFKNGSQILDEVLESGDEVRVGPFKFVFYIGVPKPKAVPPQSVVQGPAVPTQVDARYDKPVEQDVFSIINPPISEKVEVVTIEAPKPAAVEKVISIKKQVDSEVNSEKKDVPIVQKPQIQGNVVTKGIETNNGKSAKVKQSKKTFAPPSYSKNTSEIFRPGKGSVVEVALAWRERIISTQHFRGRQLIRVGPQGEIDLPMTAIGKGFVLGEVNGLIFINIFPEMNGEMILEHETISLNELEARGRLARKGGVGVLKLEQGEALRLGINNGEVNFFIRYKIAPPAISMAPLFPFSASEMTTVLVTFAIVGLLAMYVGINAPIDAAEDEKEKEVQRIAQFVYEKQPDPPKAELAEEPPPPPEPEKPKESEKPIEKKRVVSPVAGADNKGGKTGKPMDMVPKKGKEKSITSVQKGGAIKTAKAEGANANSQKKDVTKIGLFSAFGGGGNRKKLDQAYSGAGELLGLAASATGKSGQADSREGDDIGSKFKDTGAGGKGTATQGISGGLTKGRSSGESNYGSDGGGLGQRTGVQVDAGGAEEDFVGTIDREAVRRVVVSKRDAIRRCYERELRTNPDLDGRVLIEWEIVQQGRVSWAKVKSSTLDNRSVENCLKNELLTWKFPEPPKNLTATVTFPFLFKKR